MRISVHLKRITSIIAVNILIFAVAVLALEAIFGTWFFSDPIRILNISQNVNIKFLHDSPYLPAEPSRYVRDEWGLRGAYEDLANITILTVGGSTTDQMYLTEGQTWQDVLRNQFVKAGLDVTVVNAGVSGQSTYGHIRNFDLWFPHVSKLKPKYILVYVGNNDMFLDAPNRHWDQLTRGNTSSLVQKISDNSAVFYLMRTLRGMFLARGVGLTDTVVDFERATWTTESVRTDYEEIFRSRLEAYAARLSLLIERIRKFGATPIIVTQARGDYRFVDDRVIGMQGAKGRALRNYVDGILGDLDSIPFTGVDHYLILSLFNRTSIEVCHRTDTVCVDLGNELHFEIGDFYDYVHSTPQGAQKIGRYLFEKLSGDPRLSFP